MIKDEDTAFEQARQERIDQPLLSDRIRPCVEAAPWVVQEVRKLEQQLEAANTLIRAYREESTVSARLYPYPVHLENPEFRLLFESAQLIQNVGEPDRANEVRKIAYRLQDEWLAGRA